jgi:hypothetical protein
MNGDMLKVANDCQTMARQLAPLQNMAGNFAPLSAVKRFWNWAFGRTHRDISARDITKIINALLSAGNMLEYEARKQA